MWRKRFSRLKRKGSRPPSANMCAMSESGHRGNGDSEFLDPAPKRPDRRCNGVGQPPQPTRAHRGLERLSRALRQGQKSSNGQGPWGTSKLSVPHLALAPSTGSNSPDLGPNAAAAIRSRAAQRIALSPVCRRPGGSPKSQTTSPPGGALLRMVVMHGSSLSVNNCATNQLLFTALPPSARCASARA